VADLKVTTEILAACRSGDRDAFRSLYDIYRDRVFSIALYFFHGDRAAAGDAAQQVFLKLLTQVAQFRGDAEFSTWLYRMVVNTCVDMTRRRKRTTEIDETLPSPARQHQDLERDEVKDAVQDAVAELPEQFRIAVLLRHFDDLSYEEMAVALNCSAGTVASRLSRGHRMLAARLKKFHYD
jgi:RNA polymerase sigma-70 factor (ECF subfamily)